MNHIPFLLLHINSLTTMHASLPINIAPRLVLAQRSLSLSKPTTIIIQDMQLIVVLFLSLASAVSCTRTYYIVDAKHGRSLVAGDRYDGHIYHQDPRERPNAKWVLEPVHGQRGVFLIRDTKHNNYIVAGDNYDGRIYHQRPNNRPNAKWRLVPFADSFGSTTFHLVDLKHGRAIVAGNVADNKVYHQPPHCRSNARWAIIPNYIRCH